jgi:hypothetical protein
MSAREDLIKSVYALKSMSQNDMEKLVDAYAHELAEKIRAIGVDDFEDMTPGARLIRGTRAAAANLIDPEVE